MLKDSLSVSKLLSQETSGGKHGKTSVLEFLSLHLEELSRVGGLKAKRIETDVSGHVVIAKKSGLADGDILGFDPANGGTLLLSGTNGNGEGDPESNGDLGQVSDGRAGNLGVEKERRSLNLLADEETDDGKHADTSVGKFSLTVTLEGGLIGLLGESEGVEKSHRGKGTGDGVDGESQGRRLLGGSAGGEGGGRTGRESEEGGGELHFDVLVCLYVLAFVEIMRRYEGFRTTDFFLENDASLVVLVLTRSPPPEHPRFAVFFLTNERSE